MCPRSHFFFFSSRRRHTRFDCDWSSDVCSSDYPGVHAWINTQLVANADSLPQDSAHFVYRRPDLLAVPRPLARELYDADPRDPHRSEEHTSELQSQSNLVCRLLLEKKKDKKQD